jgi:hypothetical protein
MSRPLNPAERAALGVLLSVPFPGVEELRTQAETAVVKSSGFVLDLVVDACTPQADVANGVPVEAPVLADNGTEGGLILFVVAGRLSALEYWWSSDEAPADFPPQEWIGSPIVGT